MLRAALGLRLTEIVEATDMHGTAIVVESLAQILPTHSQRSYQQLEGDSKRCERGNIRGK